MSSEQISQISKPDLLRLLEAYHKRQYEIVKLLQTVSNNEKRAILKKELATTSEFITNIIIFNEIMFINEQKGLKEDDSDNNNNIKMAASPPNNDIQSEPNSQEPISKQIIQGYSKKVKNTK